MACDCIKIKDFLDSLMQLDQGCQKKVDRFNRILRNFYLDTVGRVKNIEVKYIGASGLQTIQTEFPIYKVMGFFGKGCDSKCYVPINDKCCGEGTKQLMMRKTNAEPLNGQYKMLCDDEIRAHIPVGFDGYLLYSKGPLNYSSIEDELCIDSVMRTGLELYTEMFYSMLKKEPNSVTMYRDFYNQWKEDAKDAQSNWLFYVETGIDESGRRS